MPSSLWPARKHRLPVVSKTAPGSRDILGELCGLLSKCHDEQPFRGSGTYIWGGGLAWKAKGIFFSLAASEMLGESKAGDLRNQLVSF